MTEKQPYAVRSTHEGFEVRLYPAHVLAQIDVVGEPGAGASAAFGPLFQYISGANAASARIAMTAPVVLEPRSARKQTVSFVMPATMTAESAPAPRDARVRTSVVEPRLVAASRFRGRASTSTFQEQGRRLLDAVDAEGFSVTGDVFYARFDPPSMPGFLRHNEALVALAADDEGNPRRTAPDAAQ
ncbi:MAG: heme-binding protein [Microcella sp.]|uniref:SOUL family heme-binding protein n=1 Tax=Microcella sp. TaxID=1913979 RepID=UPI003314BA2F